MKTGLFTTAETRAVILLSEKQGLEIPSEVAE
jgi:hypothetical protein